MALPFGKNTVLRFKEGPLYRVLWYQEVEYWLWVINLDDPMAMPEQMGKEYLETEYAEARLFIADDPVLSDGHKEIEVISKVDTEKLKERLQKTDEKINSRYKMIAGILRKEPDIYFQSHRALLVNQVVQEHKKSRQTIYKYLRLWWHNGCVPAGLGDNYHKCGGPGQSREAGLCKRGRPRKKKNGTGVNITSEHIKTMRLTFNRKHIANRADEIKDAYWLHMRTFYPENVRVTQDRFGSPRHIIIDITKAITYEQFLYYYRKENNLAARRMKRLGLRKFEQKYRPILDNSLNAVDGPGSRYEIDATIIDLYAVSRFSRNMIVGRPTLYLVVDVFSRLIVGFYIGLDRPSFDTAMLALLNAVEDKVEYCARYQIEIMEKEWPSTDLPSSILGDRGETMAKRAVIIERDLHIRVENTKPYAGEAKGLVEGLNKTLQAIFGPYTPGYVDTDYKERGSRDYRLDATLTIEEINRIIILAIIERNNSIRKEYPGDPRIIAEGVPFIPSDLWRWGKKNLYSEGRRLDYEYVKQRLLPQMPVAVERRGLRLGKGLYYENAEMMQQSWYFKAQDDARNKKARLKLDASHHPGNVDVIYVTSPVDPTKRYKCNLTKHSKRFTGRNYIEVDVLNNKRNEINQDAKTRVTEVKLDRRAHRDEIIEQAVREKGLEHDPSESNAQRTRNIRNNRQQELEHERQRQAEENGYVIEHNQYENDDYLEHDPDQQHTSGLVQSLRKKLTVSDGDK